MCNGFLVLETHAKHVFSDLCMLSHCELTVEISVTKKIIHD